MVAAMTDVRAEISCETQGHFYGPAGKCVFCGHPKPIEALASNFVSLADCPPGLFRWNGELCFKSEYRTTRENGTSVCDAYVVASGEYFWGGTSTDAQREALKVQPITGETPAEQDPEEHRLQFEDWAMDKGMVLDTSFFSSNPNNYCNPDTYLAYDIWCASRAALLHPKTGSALTISKEPQ
jgi:hypothetical protein